jgi:hypothetical protein
MFLEFESIAGMFLGGLMVLWGMYHLAFDEERDWQYSAWAMLVAMGMLIVSFAVR